jgi:hypothetical protein
VAIDDVVLWRRLRLVGSYRGDRQQQEQGETLKGSSREHWNIFRWFAVKMQA